MHDHQHSRLVTIYGLVNKDDCPVFHQTKCLYIDIKTGLHLLISHVLECHHIYVSNVTMHSIVDPFHQHRVRCLI